MHRASDSTLPEHGSLLYFTGVCFVAALGGLLFGFDTAVISGANAGLKAQFNLSEWMQGWVVSSALVGCVIGSGIGGWLADRFGRKKILLLSAVLFMVTGLGCSLASTPHILATARLIGGLGVGIAAMVAPLYIAEISPPHVRGRMVSFYQFAITIGVVAAYLSNVLIQNLSDRGQPPKPVAEVKVEAASLSPLDAKPSDNAENAVATKPQYGPMPGGLAGLYEWMIVREVWRGMFGTLLLPAIGFFLLLLGVPESPRWLTERGREDEALGVLARVAGRDEAQREMKDIRETIQQETGNLAELFQPGPRKLLWIAVFLACTAQLSGINAIIYYGPKILEQAHIPAGGALGGQVILGLVNVAFTVLAMWKVDTMGRRPLLLIGNTGIFLSLATIGVLFYTGSTDWRLLIFFISAYLACFAFSLGPLPWVVMSEIFPTRIRGRAMSIATLSLWAANTVVCQTFPWLNEPKHLGPAGTFWIYAAMVTPMFYFAWKVMPETKGRSLEELERILLKK